jgi:[ribosomal protein S18]-alanine N-acetyltransferase
MTTATQASVRARPTAWTDIPSLVELDGRLFADDAWPAATWWSELAARPRRDYLTLVRGDRVVGYAGLDLGGEVADVMTLAVAPEDQGAGLGARLLRLLSGRAQEAGAAYLMLEVRDDNAAAKGLYARAGFEVLSVRRRYYQPGDVDALVLRKTLQEGRDG